jgi:hypothetical protein
MRAYDAVVNGVSYRRAYLNYGVPRTTIQDRINGTKSRREGTISLQKLAPVQERCLTDWVLV